MSIKQLKRGSLNSGQFSIEFLVVVAAFLIALAVISMPLYRSTRESENRISTTMEAQEAANSLARTLNTVYRGGLDTRASAEYWLPEEAENVRADAGDNYLRVVIEIETNGSESVVSSDTLLPNSWAGGIALSEGIAVTQDRSFHRTVFTLVSTDPDAETILEVEER
ncbi:MAG: hypothetical protein ACLFUR_01720 [Candidatus Hadarchaeia archaeon]